MVNIVQINMNTSHYNEVTDRYRFNLGQMIDFSKCKLSLVTANCFNSTFNVREQYGNNRYSVKWIDGQTYNFVVPDGTYSIGDLNSFLESKYFESNLYVNITSTGKPNYFIKMQENPVSYACQLIVTYVPNSAEALTLGYSKPDGASWNFPSTSITPQLILIGNSQRFLGYSSSTFPPTPIQDDNFEILSDKAPKLSQVFNYNFNINIVNNKLGQVGGNNLFFQIPVENSIGEMIKFSPNFKLELQCVGKFDFIEIFLTDELFNKLLFKDKDISVTMLLEFDD